MAWISSSRPESAGRRFSGLHAALLIFAVTLLMLVSACGRGDAAATRAVPQILRIAFTTSSEDEIERRTTAYNELGVYLSQKLGIPVEVIKGASYSAAVEAMRSGKIDVVTASPMPYMVAHQKFGAQPLVTPALPDGTPSAYYSLFVTRPASGLRNLDDVKARSRDLVISFADPVSTSGHLIPRAHLEAIGLDPEKDFKQVVFSGTHMASIMNAKAGKLDIATVTKTSFDRMVSDGRLKPNELIPIWTSPPLLQSVVFTRPGFAPEFRSKLEAAYTAVHTERPDIWAGLRILSAKDAMHYVPLKDSAFDEYRLIAKRLTHIKLLD